MDDATLTKHDFLPLLPTPNRLVAEAVEPIYKVELSETVYQPKWSKFFRFSNDNDVDWGHVKDGYDHSSKDANHRPIPDGPLQPMIFPRLKLSRGGDNPYIYSVFSKPREEHKHFEISRNSANDFMKKDIPELHGEESVWYPLLLEDETRKSSPRLANHALLLHIYSNNRRFLVYAGGLPMLTLYICEIFGHQHLDGCTMKSWRYLSFLQNQPCSLQCLFQPKSNYVQVKYRNQITNIVQSLDPEDGEGPLLVVDTTVATYIYRLFIPANSLTIRLTLKAEIKLPGSVFGSTASPFVWDEFLHWSCDGSIYLSSQGKLTKVIQVKPDSDKEKHPNNMWCTFGSHPRIILAARERSACCIDIRGAEPRVKAVYIARDIADESSRFCILERHPSCRFHFFLVTEIHVMLFDERYPYSPLLKIPHFVSDDVPRRLLCMNNPCPLEQELETGLSYVLYLHNQESRCICSIAYVGGARISESSLSSNVSWIPKEDFKYHIKREARDKERLFQLPTFFDKLNSISGHQPRQCRLPYIIDSFSCHQSFRNTHGMIDLVPLFEDITLKGCVVFDTHAEFRTIVQLAEDGCLFIQHFSLFEGNEQLSDFESPDVSDHPHHRAPQYADERHYASVPVGHLRPHMVLSVNNVYKDFKEAIAQANGNINHRVHIPDERHIRDQVIEMLSGHPMTTHEILCKLGLPSTEQNVSFIVNACMKLCDNGSLEVTQIKPLLCEGCESGDSNYDDVPFHSTGHQLWKLKNSTELPKPEFVKRDTLQWRDANMYHKLLTYEGELWNNAQERFMSRVCGVEPVQRAEFSQPSPMESSFRIQKTPNQRDPQSKISRGFLSPTPPFMSPTPKATPFMSPTPKATPQSRHVKESDREVRTPVAVNLSSPAPQTPVFSAHRLSSQPITTPRSDGKKVQKRKMGF
eukprot:TRINITY_DN2347_c0_g1_i1.p1 TRINITY_DN2347_c0_g1~~TRINITY_DN2347_c0_g1_i1.p1  ORF type:complete len:920 (-),score=128.58 TRINITY_DN2347_c0_g1_i1:80-2839(-)